MASGGDETDTSHSAAMQAALNTCTIHTSEEIDMYCSTCSQPHCLQCIKDSHRTHDWDKLCKIAQNIRNETLNKCQQVRQSTVLDIQGYVEEVNKARIVLSDDHKKRIDKMKTQKDKIIKIIDSRLDQMTSLLEKSVADIGQNLDTMQSVLESDLTNILGIVDCLEQNRLTGSDFLIVENSNNLDNKISEIKRPSIDSLPKCVEFLEGKLNRITLESMFGSINDGTAPTNSPQIVTVSEIVNFKNGEKEISAMGVVDETSAWFLKHNETKLELLTTEGKKLKETDSGTKISDVVIHTDGDLIYTGYDSGSVNKISPDGIETKILEASPLHVEAIGLTQNGELLVAIIDDYKYVVKTSSTRLIRRVTVAGKEVTTYQFEKQSNTALFTVPVSVHENYNSDVCVVDRTGARTGQLCVLSADGDVKFRYTGQNLKGGFCPLYVTCDSQCNIILTDWENSAIHLINSSGEFVKFLATSDSGLMYPRSLCLYKDKLWVGCHYGKVKVFKYQFTTVESKV